MVIRAYTQKPEIFMGVVVSGRSINIRNIEKMVGLFINTLPLKISPKVNDNILSFLKHLQSETQEVNDYAYTPLSQIQSWSGRRRDWGIYCRVCRSCNCIR